VKKISEALKAHFGFDELRGQQSKAVEAALNARNSMVIMPTGGGKSLCYQLPAMILEKPVLVISPLIALMKDQVDALRAKNIAASSM
jgi:ATP-dependent DNA helicase RecQ